jgi:hypothetical protein
MADAWLSYADIANALGTSPEAARQKAIRDRWRRQRGNDGRALVLVDLEAEQARTRPADARTKRPDDARTVAALDAHIATLLGNIAKADTLAEERHGELQAARARLDGMDGMVGELVGQLVAMSRQMAEAAAAADRARAELEAYRSRPWWLRLAG